MDFQQSLPMRLYRLLDAVMPAYRALFAEHDLTEPQWRLLRLVWERERVTAQEAAQATLLSPQSVVGIVDRLVAKGLVTRLRSVNDRRVVYLLPTAGGRALSAVVLPQVQAIRDALDAALDTGEWETLSRLFDKIERRATDADEVASQIGLSGQNGQNGQSAQNGQRSESSKAGSTGRRASV